MTYYYWDEVNDNLFGEEDANGEVTASYTHEPGLYGELIAQERDGETRYYNYDGLGNTVELTDENQNVTDTYEYSAFGEEVARTGTTENPFGYKGAVGYYANPETGDLYVRARNYEPAVGRWISIDPMQFAAIVRKSKFVNVHRSAERVEGQDFGTISNGFAYANGNPVLLWDPSGLVAICCQLSRGNLFADFKYQEVDCPDQVFEMPGGARKCCLAWLAIIKRRNPNSTLGYHGVFTPEKCCKPAAQIKLEKGNCPDGCRLVAALPGRPKGSLGCVKIVPEYDKDDWTKGSIARCYLGAIVCNPLDPDGCESACNECLTTNKRLCERLKSVYQKFKCHSQAGLDVDKCIKSCGLLRGVGGSEP